MKNPISSQTRLDLLTAALHGGSNYWYFLSKEADSIAKRHELNEKEPFVDSLWKAIETGEEIPIHDVENEINLLGKISLKSIEEGEELMLSKLPEHFANIIRDNWDAETADVWFQLAVMKDLVYG